jgi:hypothetical protein
MEKPKTLKALDCAIDDHVKYASNEEGTFITGWVLIASVSSPSHDASSSDGYISFSSEGMPHHAGYGLLSLALEEKKNLGFMQAMVGVMQQLNADEEDEEE